MYFHSQWFVPVRRRKLPGLLGWGSGTFKIASFCMGFREGFENKRIVRLRLFGSAARSDGIECRRPCGLVAVAPDSVGADLFDGDEQEILAVNVLNGCSGYLTAAWDGKNQGHPE